MIKQEENSPLKERIINRQYNNMRNLRNNTWYDERSMHFPSQIHSGLTMMKKYQNIFNRDDSIITRNFLFFLP